MTAEQSHSRPSQILPWISSLCELNPFVAYELDAAVATFAIVIKNALQERVESGEGSSYRSRPKYRLEELLDDRFQFKSEDPLAIFKGLDGYEEMS